MNTCFFILLVFAGFALQIAFVYAWCRARRFFGIEFKMSRPAIGWCMSIIASICLLVAVVSFFYSRNFLAVAQKASATVTALNEHSMKDEGKTLYAPSISFRDALGVEHKTHLNLWSSTPIYHIGEKVLILYSQKEPEYVHLDEPSDVWAAPMITGVLGTIFFILGIVVLNWPRLIDRFQKV